MSVQLGDKNVNECPALCPAETKGTCRPAENTTADAWCRICPRFPPITWHVHELILDNGDQTNNFIEALKSRSESLLGYSFLYF